MTPILGPDGRPEKLLSVSRDITAQKIAEERQELLHQELAHRVKNMLALIQAIAVQTIRGDARLDEVRQAFGSRLMAVARANDVLLQASWTEATLGALVEASTRVHGKDAAARFRVNGPDLRIGPKAALSFALALHELGTNAMKYGALSREGGLVEIDWEISDGPEMRWSFRWQELGGPTVSPPARTGFGSKLIDRTLASSLGATVELSYPSTGVVLTVVGPVAALQET